MSFNTLSKALDIIELLMKTSVPMNIADISEELKMPRSTLYKYMAVLREKGFLEYDNTSGSYNLGLKFLELASVVEEQSALDKIAFPHMKKLYLKERETIILSVLRFGKAYCLERIEGEGGIVFSMQPGSHLPLHCGASAKVLLAFCDENIDQLLGNEELKKYTPYTITDREAIKKQLQEIRRAGYVYTDQEVDIGARAISAPIFNRQRKLAGGLCVAGPLHRISEERIDPLKKKIITCAQAISAEL